MPRAPGQLAHRCCGWWLRPGLPPGSAACHPALGGRPEDRLQRPWRPHISPEGSCQFPQAGRPRRSAMPPARASPLSHRPTTAGGRRPAVQLPNLLVILILFLIVSEKNPHLKVDGEAWLYETPFFYGDIKNKTCIIIDDIVDTAGTLCNAAKSIKNKGAKSVSAYITHGVLSVEAVAKISKSPIKNLVITNSIELTQSVETSEKIQSLTVAPLLGEAIKRISLEKSVSVLFD